MERQRTTSHSLKSIAGAALVGLGFAILLEKLDEPAAQWMTNLLGAAARDTLQLLLSLIPAVWQALQVYGFPCPLQMLVSFWPLLRVVAGAL